LVLHIHLQLLGLKYKFNKANLKFVLLQRNKNVSIMGDSDFEIRDIKLNS